MRWARARRCVVALVVCCAGRAAGAQDLTCDAGDREVSRLSFTGNSAFRSSLLADGIVTTPSSWARRNLDILPRHVLGTRRCLDPEEFPRDVLRLLRWYQWHGYSSVTVDTIVKAMGKGRIGVTFSIHEGQPLILQSFAVTGLEAVPERSAVVRGLATAAGRPFDRYAMQEARDTITSRLHNGGYPDAEVFVSYETQLAARTAVASMSVVPGPRAHLDSIAVRLTSRAGGTPVTGVSAVRRAAGLRTGDLYSERELERAKRSLYQTEAFSHVIVTSDSLISPADSAVGVTLDVTEGFMRSARVGGGWGTLDCFRATGELTQYNFLGGATRLDLDGRVSKIGVGNPLGGLEKLCPQAHSDAYSKDLNYHAGATLSQPAIFRDFLPTLALYSERRSEYNAYLRTTPVGGSLSLTRLLAHMTQSASYTVEYGRTEAQPALLCAVFNACEEADRASFRRSQLLAVASFALTSEHADNAVSPTRGNVVRLEWRTAGSYTGSDPGLRFNKFLADGALYMPVGSDVVLAARLRMGAVIGPSLSFSNATIFVPQQERLFAGGPTTVRGFRQNELGPAVYIPTGYDTVRASGQRGGDPSNPSDTVYFRSRADSSERVVPTGGNALVVAMLEARVRSPVFPEVLQFTVFADAGSVWNRGSGIANLGFNSLRVTPGIGMRLRTLIGVLRIDVAYNPYERPAGAAYFDAPLAAGGALFCVSPSNTLRVTTTTGGLVQQAPGSCPATFQPVRQSGFFRRLSPSITIGQAF